ncbi:MAG: patatin-like phospholipase family protein [Halanaerobiales bacterium]
MSRYRVLCFDGGGIRGALTIRMLVRLQNRLPGLLDEVDLYSGTSTGAIIAIGLSAGLKVSELEEVYTPDICRKIFQPCSSGLVRPRYNINRFKEIISSIFPRNMCLRDLKYNIVIPAFNISGKEKMGWRPVFFSNLPDSENSEEKIIDVVMASCAAPVYFSSYNDYIDGGVVANNPSAVALSFAVGRLCNERSFSRLRLFSMGTGFLPNNIKYNTSIWGAIQWLLNTNPPVPLINLLMDGDARADDMVTSQMMGKNYHRLNPILPEPIGIDHYTKIDFLKDFADNIDMNETVNWLQDYWL